MLGVGQTIILDSAVVINKPMFTTETKHLLNIIKTVSTSDRKNQKMNNTKFWQEGQWNKFYLCTCIEALKPWSPQIIRCDPLDSDCYGGTFTMFSFVFGYLTTNHSLHLLLPHSKLFGHWSTLSWWCRVENWMVLHQILLVCLIVSPGSSEVASRPTNLGQLLTSGLLIYMQINTVQS